MKYSQMLCKPRGFHSYLKHLSKMKITCVLCLLLMRKREIGVMYSLVCESKGVQRVLQITLKSLRRRFYL